MNLRPLAPLDDAPRVWHTPPNQEIRSILRVFAFRDEARLAPGWTNQDRTWLKRAKVILGLHRLSASLAGNLDALTGMEMLKGDFYAAC